MTDPDRWAREDAAVARAHGRQAQDERTLRGVTDRVCARCGTASRVPYPRCADCARPLCPACADTYCVTSHATRHRLATEAP